MSRIILLSDTHNQLKDMTIPEGDMVIHAGDATMGGRVHEAAHFARVFGELPHKHKVLCAGNHDFLAEKDPTLWKTLMEERGIVYLEQREAEVMGLRFFGSPYTPWFYDWAFNLQRGAEIKEKWDKIPAGIDVLVTHGPPYGILDKVTRDNSDSAWEGREDLMFLEEHVGCEELAKAVERVRPKMHVFGHIHCARGVLEKDGTLFVNAANCNEAYDPVNKPVVVDYTDGNFICVT